jgi:hypothetical protein
MNDTRRPFTRLGRPLTVLLAARALTGCGLMPDVTSIRNAAADARPGADPSLARGRIHIVVDGQDHVPAVPGRWCTAWSTLAQSSSSSPSRRPLPASCPAPSD